ncbi:MAG: DtxR family transcriptional regulator [Saprospiraceae bacterium]|nr:DtxR family transcriptional regulator [Saprospiraceae bacterium]
MKDQSQIMILEIQPGIQLLIGIGIVAMLIWIFWPGHGLISLFSRTKMNSQRVQLEDALKYLFDCEYKKKVCDINSIAGNLQISVDKAGRLIQKMLSLELVSLTDHYIQLTDAGRSYALRVIRVHRIWERYLADETGVQQTDWHLQADQLEHYVTNEDTEKIAAKLGHPVFDPHGDPIPTIEGEIPHQKGKSLADMKEGEIGNIIHIEDEPKSIYEQLVVQGLYPGMQVYVTDVSDRSITIVADGEECNLTPLFANQITVELQAKNTTVQSKYELLSSLKVGEAGEVVGISPNLRGPQRRRLMDLGFVPGSLVSAEIKSASGDPTGYRVMGTTIGIRRKQADMIFINKKDVKKHA